MSPVYQSHTVFATLHLTGVVNLGPSRTPSTTSGGIFTPWSAITTSTRRSASPTRSDSGSSATTASSTTSRYILDDEVLLRSPNSVSTSTKYFSAATPRDEALPPCQWSLRGNIHWEHDDRTDALPDLFKATIEYDQASGNCHVVYTGRQALKVGGGEVVEMRLKSRHRLEATREGQRTVRTLWGKFEIVVRQ